MSSQLDRIESMLRALCAHLGVQVEERAGNGAGEGAGVEGGRRLTGVVSRFEHGWGFIECEAMNRHFFVHYSDIEGTGLRSLDPGEGVSFELAPGKDGRPKAVRVRRQGASRPAPRPARASIVSPLVTVGDLPEEDGEDAPEAIARPGRPRAVEGEDADR